MLLGSKGTRMKRLQVFLTLVMVILLCGTAHATQYSFTDQHKYWTGWGSPESSENSQDVIGNPQLTGGYITVQNGYLTSVAIQGSGYRISGGPRDGQYLPFGDLFLDINSDNVWDYVVSLNGSTSRGYYSIYSVTLGLNSSTGYKVTGSDSSGYWSGYDIRNGHPWALANGVGSAVGTAYFSGIAGDGTLTFSSFGNLIGVGSTVTLGWTVGCANDVIYEQVRVPEPSITLLLGFGFAALAFRRRVLHEG